MDFSTIKAMRDEHIVEGRPDQGERAGLMTPERLRETEGILFQLKIIPELIPLDRFVRFDFMPAVDLQLGAQLVESILFIIQMVPNVSCKERRGIKGAT